MNGTTPPMHPRTDKILTLFISTSLATKFILYDKCSRWNGPTHTATNHSTFQQKTLPKPYRDCGMSKDNADGLESSIDSPNGGSCLKLSSGLDLSGEQPRFAD